MYKQIAEYGFGKVFISVRNDVILRVSDNAIIPFDLANTDYQVYLKWLEEGNTPLPAEVTE
jgi:hypothetical protein